MSLCQVDTIPIVEGPAYSMCKTPVLETYVPCVDVFVNRLHAIVVVIYTKTLDAFSNDTIDVVFDNWVSRSAVTVEGDRNRDLVFV